MGHFKLQIHGEFLSGIISLSNLPSQDDVLTAGGGDEDVSFLASLIHGGDLVTYRGTERERAHFEVQDDITHLPPRCVNTPRGKLSTSISVLNCSLSTKLKMTVNEL